jgi:hypothetical protein
MMAATDQFPDYALVTISLLKRHLREEMSPETRIQFLESLEFWEADLGADLVEAIEPMCDRAYQILTEALKIGGTASAVDFFTDRFSTFAALNPSLIGSMKAASILRTIH